MKRLREIACFSAAVALACMLPSCIDGDEEVWLNPDGSGRAELEYSVPTTAVRLYGGEDAIRKMIEESVKSAPELTFGRHEVFSENGKTRIRVGISFRSAKDLIEVTTGEAMESLPSAAAHLAGEVGVELKGMNLNVTRSFSPGKAIPGATLLPASQLAGHRLTTTVHLPKPAGKHNATRSADSGRTLIWESPLAKAVKAPVIQQFEMPLPVPRMAMVGGMIAITAAGLLVARTIRRKKGTFPGRAA